MKSLPNMSAEKMEVSWQMLMVNGSAASVYMLELIVMLLLLLLLQWLLW